MLDLIGAPYGIRTRVSALREPKQHLSEFLWFSVCCKQDNDLTGLRPLGRTPSTERSTIISRGWKARVAGKRTLLTRAPRPQRPSGPLGHVRVDRLTSKQISDWLHALAKAPPRLRSKAGMKPRYRASNRRLKPGRDPLIKRRRLFKQTEPPLWSQAAIHAKRSVRYVSRKAISKILLNEFDAIAYDQVPNPMASEVQSARPPAR